MRSARWIVLATALALGAGAVAGCGLGGGEQADQGLYTCGMHPDVIHEGPGLCPLCHMELTPMADTTFEPAAPKVEPGSTGVTFSTAAGDAVVSPSANQGGPVTIDPVVVQNMGVRIAPVERGSLSRHVRTIGEIEVAEDEISVVNLRYSGWIERIHVDQTGEEVRAGQALFDLYKEGLVSAQTALQNATSAKDLKLRMQGMSAS